MHCCAHAGLDKNTAQQILKVWEKSGAKSPDELRKLLIQRSVRSAGAVLVQTVLDAGDVPIAFSHQKSCLWRVTVTGLQVADKPGLIGLSTQH